MLNEVQVIKMIHAKQVKKQKGASMIEYALVVAAVASIAALVFSGTTTDGLGKVIKDKVDSAATAAAA
jgi:Flp pilus assembly pilin Flp